MSVGTLYLCATPIGNLEDITLRVIRTLKEVDLIAAEDTRNSMKLLTHFDIHTPITSYHKNNRYDKAETLINKLLDGRSIALITDAGMPCVSDPGEELARLAAENGIPVTVLPGACAAVTALAISGLSTGRFCFEGFLPQNKKDRKEALAGLVSETRTIIIYEAPHHLTATLRDLLEQLGDRQISVCRELTKVHETVFRTTIKEAVATYEATTPRGECVLVIKGIDSSLLLSEQQNKWQELSVSEHMDLYLSQGMDKKNAMKAVAKDRGVTKQEIYKACL
ncbi:MAG: 16S rRNA (cytidine(1402)-2'-O)-methyltransferase [Lachnospiraceae bacterium]|nr:16S rRNA (cytidine(1402)-2'-O)-methyltransferase [Lachnospiraceae bacterium]